MHLHVVQLMFLLVEIFPRPLLSYANKSFKKTVYKSINNNVCFHLPIYLSVLHREQLLILLVVPLCASFNDIALKYFQIVAQCV